MINTNKASDIGEITGINKGMSRIMRGLTPAPPIIQLPQNITEKQKQLLNDGWPIHAFDKPVEIYPRLWLSGIGFDEDLPGWCKKEGFTHIVNAAGKYARRSYYKTHPCDHNIKYLELDMDDVPQCELKPFMSKMYSFIYHGYETEGKILIHCMWGQSRSVSCLIYFMMMYWGIKYDASIDIIMKSRPAASPNRGFQLQLRSIDISRYSNLNYVIPLEPLPEEDITLIK